MSQSEQWKLFFATGLPEAYTYLKAKGRRDSRQQPPSGGKDRRS